MSRAYRIQVKESVTDVVRAEDEVSSRLELLGILPPEQMADLLGLELEERGYQRDGSSAKKTQDGVEIDVDLTTGEVKVRAEGSREVSVDAERMGSYFDDFGPGKKETKEQLEGQLQKDLAEAVDQKQRKLQSEITDRLEGQLRDVKQELDQSVNRATAEALKQKAAKLGQIKEITEDQEAGSLTIRVEV